MKIKFLNFLSSRIFLKIIIGLFAFEALWIALTGRYPGAFDENFHFGLIKIYANHWLPFLDSQPPDAAVYGAVARDPSYLYHYLMSFPYRLIELFTQSQTVQIIVLRIINVLFAVTGLYLFARILTHSPLSRHAQHAILLLFTLIPVLPLLAGQINYDNLLFVFAAAAILLMLSIVRDVRQGNLSGSSVARLLIVCGGASLVKYAFLPIFVAIVFFVAWQCFTYRKRLTFGGPDGLPHRFVSAVQRPTSCALLVGILLVGGLGFQRYGVNVLRYHTPIPDCAQVISVRECSQYAPWNRDHMYVQNNAAWKRESIIQYADMWIHQILRELYFVIYGAFMPNGKVSYRAAEPLPFMIILGWTICITGTLAMLICIRLLWRDWVLRAFMLIIGTYTGILFVQNYKMYVETAVPVAIHGRYLLLLLPLLFVLYFRSYQIIFRYLASQFAIIQVYRRHILLVSWLILLLVSTQGGGILTYIVRSNSEWFWQQSPAAQSVNNSARSILKPLIVEQTL
jgi:hypothetical protein